MFQRLTGKLHILTVAAIEIVMESLTIDICWRRTSYWHHICVDQAGKLEHALHLFASCHMALIRSLFDPNTALVIHIGFGKAIGHADHHYDAVGRLHIFSERMHRRTRVL